MIFYLSVYKDLELAKLTVARLNYFYPKQRILVRFDGTDGYIQNCTNIHTSRLYVKNNAGLVTQTYLSLALQFNFDYLIKLDPDTFVNGSFDFNSLSKDILHCNHTKDYTFGGLIVYPYNIAKHIHQSQLLMSKEYKNQQYNYNNRKVKEQVSCQDLIQKNVIDRLNIQIKPVNSFAQIELKKIKSKDETKYFHHSHP